MAAAGGSSAGVALLLSKGARVDTRGALPFHLTPLDCAVGPRPRQSAQMLQSDSAFAGPLWL